MIVGSLDGDRIFAYVDVESRDLVEQPNCILPDEFEFIPNARQYFRNGEVIVEYKDVEI